MKLLLTSGGLENESIINALSELAQIPFSKLKVAFIPTASNLEAGDKWWLIADLKKLQELKFACVDIVDVSALPKEVWMERLKESDIIVVEGGNTYHLMYWFNQSGLSQILPELLNSKVYVGISAGSLIVTPSILNSKSEKPIAQKTNGISYDDGLNLVNFMVEPHINSKYFPELNFENLEKQSKDYKYPIYGLDDNSAIKVDGENIEVVSEGKWKKFN